MADTGKTVSFANDIKPYFQQFVGNMHWRFDLSNYDQVKANAELILGRIQTKTMPPLPFDPFPDELIENFQLWITQDYPE